MAFLNNGHAEKVYDIDGYFIPHLEVIKPQTDAKTTKF